MTGVAAIGVVSGAASAAIGLWTRLNNDEKIYVVAGLAVMLVSVSVAIGTLWYWLARAIAAQREQSEDILTLLQTFRLRDTGMELEFPHGQFTDDAETLRRYRRLITEGRTWHPDRVADLRRLASEVAQAGGSLKNKWGTEDDP